MIHKLVEKSILIKQALLLLALAFGLAASLSVASSAQTYDPFLGQWLDIYGNVVPAPNQAPSSPSSSNQGSNQAPSLPRLQAAPSVRQPLAPLSPPPKPQVKGELFLPADAADDLVATEVTFGNSEPDGTLETVGGQAEQPSANPATAADLDIEEPEATGQLFTEPLGILALGEGALVLDPALMEEEPSLEALLSGSNREQRLKELGLGDKIALLSTSEEAERKRNQMLFQRALQERDPPFARRFARLRAMEKITARMTTIDVPVGQTVQFGTVSITPRVCYENPPTEPPESASYLEISDQPVSREAYQVFNGWMFASSPALSAMDHPIYDVWVLACLDIE